MLIAATLGLFHEANTFSPIKADQALYADGGVLRGEVWRIDARTGETTGVVHVSTRYPTSCAFGGDSLSTLFITSAAHENAAGGGLLYAVDVPVHGREPHRFSGALR